MLKFFFFCLVVALEKILPELIINFDQIGLKYVQVSDWTMARQGSKSVPLSSLGDKCQFLLAHYLATTAYLQRENKSLSSKVKF